MKIFGIGFHRTGTSSLHDIFTNCGLNSSHTGIYFKFCNKYNFDKDFMNEHDCYFDGFENIHTYTPTVRGYEGNICPVKKKIYSNVQLPQNELMFPDCKMLLKNYPESVFIFHDRSLKNWFKSRVNIGEYFKVHWNDRTFDETFLATWFKSYIDHKTYVINFFKDKPEKLLIINVCDNSDEINMLKLRNFFPTLSFANISHKNKSSEQIPMQQSYIDIIDQFCDALDSTSTLYTI
jgi:hypothetical protein